MGLCSFSNCRGCEDAVVKTGPPSGSELFNSVGLMDSSLSLAVMYHPRPGMYSYWPGSGVAQYSVTLVGRSVLDARNHLCGWNTFWVARRRLGVISADYVEVLNLDFLVVEYCVFCDSTSVSEEAN
jgi:hypothetical protein